MPMLVYFQSKPWVRQCDNQCILVNKHHICSLNAKLGKKKFLCIWKSLDQLLSNPRRVGQNWWDLAAAAAAELRLWKLCSKMKIKFGQNSKDTFRMKTGDTF